MSAVTAVSQRYTISGSGVRKWCDGGRERCQDCDDHGIIISAECCSST